MTQEEKELLADRVVAILRDPDPRIKLTELRRQVDAGEEGPDGCNSLVLALATALFEHLRS